MRKPSTFWLPALVGLAVAIVSAASARADFIPALTAVTGTNPTIPNPNGVAPFTFTYTVDLTVGEREQMNGGGPPTGIIDNQGHATGPNFWTIYDFDSGNVALNASTITMAAGWNFSVQPTGINPAGVSPFSGIDTAIQNITFYWTGLNTAGPQNYTFTLQSQYNGIASSGFTQQATRDGTAADGLADSGNGPLIVSANTNILFTPLPSSFHMCGVAILGIAALKLRGRNSFRARAC